MKVNVSMTADVDAGSTMVGTSSKPYQGTFDGAGHSLAFSYSGSGSYIAPFAYVKDATIQNLKTTGSITSSSNLLAGIVGQVMGTTTVNNCSSSMSITSTDGDNGRIGGIVARCAETGASLILSNCLFNGSLSSAKSGYANGFVGWSNGTTVNLSSLFLNPSSVTNGGERFSNVKTSQEHLWFNSTSFQSNTGGTQSTEAKLISGEVAYDLQHNQATQYWGHANLNRSNVAALPEMTSESAKKVIKITFSHNGALSQYANVGGALPSPTSPSIKALSYYAGGENDPYTSLSEDKQVYRSYAKYSLTVGDAGATTLVLPVAVETLPTGVKAYELTYTAGNNSLTATEVTSITANKPVLINAKKGTYVFVSTNSSEITYETTAQQNGVLWGVYPADTYEYVPANTSSTGDDYYVLQKGTDGLGFYKVDSENSIRITAFRAYAKFTYSGTSTSRQFFGINFLGDEASGIETVNDAVGTMNGSDVYYNLNGVRVENPTKGIYVKGGKKYVVR